ncbi:MAG: STAS/SEC14 domain-containing protein, partial [Bryobacteraceae bacterium]
SRKFPGWQSVGALFAHLKFVNSVHDKIGKIALVTNSPMGTFADHVLDPLMLAKVRKFDYDERDNAMSWLRG